MTTLERLALALHEAHLGDRCRAKGAERRLHITTYYAEAVEAKKRLHPTAPSFEKEGRA